MRLANLLIALSAIACSGCAAKPASVRPGDTARNVRVVQPGDPELFAIATAAARSLDPGGDWPAQFTGISIGGRALISLSDSVAREARVTLTEAGTRKVPYVIARTGDGSSPEVQRALRAFTYTFTHFRATPDSAYVGGTAAGGNRPDRSICIALARAGTLWATAETRTVQRAQGCGA